MKSLKIQMNVQAKQKQTHRQNQKLAKGNREGQIRDMGLTDKTDSNTINCIA